MPTANKFEDLEIFQTARAMTRQINSLTAYLKEHKSTTRNW
jgi:hypothetical protein